jgi:hypothetical protein
MAPSSSDTHSTPSWQSPNTTGSAGAPIFAPSAYDPIAPPTYTGDIASASSAVMPTAAQRPRVVVELSAMRQRSQSSSRNVLKRGRSPA